MNKAVPLPGPVGTAVVEPVGRKPIFLSSPAVMSYYSFPLEPLGKSLTTAITLPISVVSGAYLPWSL